MPFTLELRSNTTLQLRSPLLFILPVDPMAWSKGSSGQQVPHDVLLSVSRSGELVFWVPDENADGSWRRTGYVRTGRTGISMARCSSAKKSVLGT